MALSKSHDLNWHFEICIPILWRRGTDNRDWAHVASSLHGMRMLVSGYVPAEDLGLVDDLLLLYNVAMHRFNRDLEHSHAE